MMSRNGLDWNARGNLTVANLARAQWDKGRYGKSLEWGRDSGHHFEKWLGKGHGSTLTENYCIGTILEAQGNYGGAIRLYEQCTRSSRRDSASTIATR